MMRWWPIGIGEAGLPQPEKSVEFRKNRVEKDFMSWLSKKMKAMWYIVHHIADVWLWNKFLDLIVVRDNWGVIFIECKKIEWYTFNVSQFEPSQVMLMRELDKRNTEAYVAIYSKKTHTWMYDTFSNIFNSRNEKWWIQIFKPTTLLLNDYLNTNSEQSLPRKKEGIK